jgi:hypothetical protein
MGRVRERITIGQPLFTADWTLSLRICLAGTAPRRKTWPKERLLRPTSRTPMRRLARVQRTVFVSVAGLGDLATVLARPAGFAAGIDDEVLHEYIWWQGEHELDGGRDGVRGHHDLLS